MKKFVSVFLVFSSLSLGGFCLLLLFTPHFVETESSIQDLNIQLIRKRAHRDLSEQNPPLILKDFQSIRENLVSKKKDFLEANLGEMKIKIYKEGSLTEEVPIFRKGNPERWGGTSLGSYQILSKHKLAYSILADSYMPWSLHVYGKYYIHGDNYYAGGRIDTLPITGGCLRLSNNNAKIVYDLAEIGLPVLVMDQGLENDGYGYSSQDLEEFPQLTSRSYLIADLDSGFVFAEKDYQKQLSIASITKLMTTIVIAEIVDLRKSILINSKMLESPQSTKDLVAGESFRAFELFYPLLVESSNDAAEALGYFLGKERTIKLMNEKAKAILMTETKFVDLSGLDSQNVSTCQDLFYLARYILSARPMLLEISRGEEVWTFSLPMRFKNLENKNLFSDNPNFLGGKTGFIQASQSTGLFIFRFSLEDDSERRVAIILLGSAATHGFPVNLEKDVKKILDWLKENHFSE